jgi:hypothetical protein
MLTSHLWQKVAVLAISGGTAFALFGGAAVHTQLSSSAPGQVQAIGANVANTLESTPSYNITSDTGTGEFQCSNLVPGAGPGSNWGAPGDPGWPGWCQETLTFTNTGNVDQVFSLTLNQFTSVSNAIDNWPDLGALQFAFSPGTPSGPYAYAVGDTWTFGVVTPTTPLTVTLDITLASGASNDWNNANVVIPFTVTATAGS